MDKHLHLLKKRIGTKVQMFSDTTKILRSAMVEELLRMKRSFLLVTGFLKDYDQKNQSSKQNTNCECKIYRCEKVLCFQQPNIAKTLYIFIYNGYGASTNVIKLAYLEIEGIH